MALVAAAVVLVGTTTTVRSKLNDAAAYYYGSRCLLHGRNPYDNATIVAAWVRDGSPARVKPGVPQDMYLTPPIEALFMAPAVPLPFRIARYVINGMSIAEYLLAAYLLTLLPASPWSRATRRWFWVLLPWGAFQAVMVLGQISPSICLMLAASLHMLRRRRDVWAGIFMGFGLAKFTITLPFLAIAAYRGRWKAAVVAVAVFAAVDLLLLLPIGPRTALTDYQALVRYALAPGHIDDAGGNHPSHIAIVQTKRLFFMLLGQNRPLVEHVNLAFTLIAVVLLAAILRPRPGRAPAFEHPLEIAAAAMAALSLMYHHHNDLTVLAFVVYGLLEYRRRWPERQPGTWKAAVVLTVLAAYQQNIYLRLPVLPGLVQRATGISALGPPAVLALFVAIVWMLAFDVRRHPDMAAPKSRTPAVAELPA